MSKSPNAALEQMQSIPLMLFYGQSWMQANSDNGRVLHENPYPDQALMLNGGINSLITCDLGPIKDGFDGYCPALDWSDRIQTVVTPFLYRYVAEAMEDGRPSVCVGHSGAVSGARLERLLPASDPRHEDATAFDNLMLAVRAHMKSAADLGKAAHVPYLIFCQGAANRTMTKQAYAVLVEDLLNILQAEIVRLTGQDTAPHILMIQPPGKGNGGAWPCLQAQVELCAARPDMTLAVSGWAIEQHDRIHFSGEGAVGVGELCAIVARGIENGVDCSAPWIRSARRRGAKRIVLNIAASGDLVVDTERASPRHLVDGAPVPAFGFEAACNSISKIAVRPRKVIVKFEQEPPQELAYAYHDGSDYLPSRADKANQSANRGNLRLKQGWRSMFMDVTLHHWLASGHISLSA